MASGNPASESTLEPAALKRRRSIEVTSTGTAPFARVSATSDRSCASYGAVSEPSFWSLWANWTNR